MSEQSLYERLGGVFAVAAVVDHFSDAIVKNPIVGQASPNPALREWHTLQLGRLPGLKFMRTLWVCNVAGGPFTYVGTHPGRDEVSLEEAHRRFSISPRRIRRSGSRAGSHARRRWRPRPGEGRGPGGLCGTQGRGHRRLPGGRGPLSTAGVITEPVTRPR